MALGGRFSPLDCHEFWAKDKMKLMTLALLASTLMSAVSEEVWLELGSVRNTRKHPGNLTAKALKNGPVNQEGKGQFQLPNFHFSGAFAVKFRGRKG